jgi:hypothetical protein
MAEHDNAAAPASAAGADEAFRVIVGWSHWSFSRGIQFKLQSRRAEGQGAGAVEDQRFLMTRNQALLLARYLLEASGQTLPERTPNGPVRRLLRRLTGG